MVNHVIIWTLNDKFTEDEKVKIKKDIKEGLESLKGVIPGLLEINVLIDGLESSNADLMLDSKFENIEALKNYSVHPEHVKVANDKVRPFTAIRSCFDYEI
ncbi:MAG: Dabb family protein [Agathobacter sp.]|nr:Dabb family protein [Agathobacter sp.]